MSRTALDTSIDTTLRDRTQSEIDNNDPPHISEADSRNTHKAVADYAEEINLSVTVVTAAAKTTDSADFKSPPAYIRFSTSFEVGLGTAATADVGKQIHCRNITGSATSITAASGVTLNGLKGIANNEALTLICVAENEFDVIGGTS